MKAEEECLKGKFIVINNFSTGENTDENFKNVSTSKYKSLWNMELTTDESCFLLDERNPPLFWSSLLS